MKHQTERIERWREAFCDDTTGIRKTVEDLLWNYAAFQTTVQIVRASNERQDCGMPLNQMLFNLISEGYWSSLLLGTRRLLDKHPVKGPKGVYSIRSVVKDVEDCRCWLSRRIYVEMVHHAEYDTEQLLQEMNKKLTAAKGPVWGDPKISKSKTAHRYFDALSGVSPPDRSPDDLISPTIFAKIEARLAALDKIGEHVSSHVAHAGNKESRHTKTLENFDIQDARTTLKQLKEVSTLIGVWFANEGSGDLATFIGDQFEGLDHPIVSRLEIQKLEDNWQSTEIEIAGWSIKAEEL